MSNLTPNEERAILWLLGSDADVVVDALGITTRDLLTAFPHHVNVYLDHAQGVDEDEQDEGEDVAVS
jgi:hypothetical protein